MFLPKILAYKEKEVAVRKEKLPLVDIFASLDRESMPLRPFEEKLMMDSIALIAEIKKASPSKGLLCPDFEPVKLAESYERAGAAAISVLTEVDFFQGSIDYLPLVKKHTSTTPILRKDFIIDPYQIAEARLYGADAVLLIVAVLSQKKLESFIQEVSELGMTPLVEVHHQEELERALDAGSGVIGINNRDLTTFEVNIQTTYHLLEKIPQGITVVAESGIKERADIEGLEKAGVHGVLIGEALVTAKDPASQITSLLGRKL